MKIQIISDLHQEFGVSELSFGNADLVILAGDINLGTKGIEWIKENVPDKPVIYVLGNHEYYKGTYPNTLHKIMEASRGSNVCVLENDHIDFGGIRFHGATLWTDFSLFGNPVEYGIICQAKMNDYKLIRRDPSYSKLRTIDTFKIHQVSKKWLGKSLEESKAYKNVVISHHAPSIKSILDIPLYSLPPFRWIYYQLFRFIAYQYSEGNITRYSISKLTRYSGAKFTICNDSRLLNA